MTTTRIIVGAAALAATAIGASGCASVKGPAMEVDSAYVAYVEAAAKRYSTQVYWVNPPMRPVQTPAKEPLKQ